MGAVGLALCGARVSRKGQSPHGCVHRKGAGAAVIVFWVRMKPHKLITFRSVVRVAGTAIGLMLEPGWRSGVTAYHPVDAPWFPWMWYGAAGSK